MFWNDPIFYGATFPYKEFVPPYQLPYLGAGYTPWMNLPKFAPQPYGFVPQPYGFVPQQYPLPQFPIGLHQAAVPPFMRELPGINPYLQAFEMNRPFFGGYKPFMF